MKSYARVERSEVLEIIEPFVGEAGNEVPIELRFTAEFFSTLVDITDQNPKPDQRWTYDGSVFLPSTVYVPSPEEIKASNTSTRDFLLDQATRAINPLQDAVDIDDATPDDVALLKK